jgi:hypothetical protein
VDLPDYVGVLCQSVGEVGPALDCWDSTLGKPKFDVKRGAIKSTEVSHLIGGVDNHVGLLDERETKDGINGDIGSGCNAEGGGSSLACEIWHMKLKTNGEFSYN